MGKPSCSSKLYSCPAGHKRTAATNDAKFCSGASASSCATTADCCEKDAATCEGQMGGKTCPTNTYYSAASKALAADAGNALTNCCSGSATCAIATCPAGKKKKKDSDKTFCTSDVSTCEATCCEADAETCGGVTGIRCAAGFFKPSTAFVTGDADESKNTPKAVMDAWKLLAANETTKNTVCCAAQAQCTNVTTKQAVVVVQVQTNAGEATTTPAAMRLYSQQRLPSRRLTKEWQATWFGSVLEVLLV